MDGGTQDFLQVSPPSSSTYSIHVYNPSLQQQPPPQNTLQADQEILRTAAADGMQTVAVAMAAVDEASAAGAAAAAEKGEQSIRSLSQAAQFHSHTQNRPVLYHNQNPTDSRNVHGSGGVCNMKKVVRYRECRKNQAATVGGYAIDGCGEFTPSSADEDGTPGLQCAACHCHRNFHRREAEGEKPPSYCQHTRR